MTKPLHPNAASALPDRDRAPDSSASVVVGLAANSAEEDLAYVDLGAYRNPDYNPGRGFLVRTLWYFISLMVFESGWFPVSRPKTWILRRFGARMGTGVVIKSQVRIKYPWRLVVGDHCWIGQEVWIDNLADVQLGSHVCISQRSYLCTGSHDHRQRTFDLITKPITVRNGAWLGAGCLVLGGVTVEANAIVAAGSVVTKDVAAATIVAGNPAKLIAHRGPSEFTTSSTPSNQN